MPRSGARSPFTRLRETCQFWADERKHIACCQFADDEALQFEAETFDCGTCQVLEQLDGLDVDNRRAWDLAHLLVSRLVFDTGSFGPLLQRLTPDLDEDAFGDLVRRITLIYDVLAPPPSPRRE